MPFEIEESNRLSRSTMKCRPGGITSGLAIFYDANKRHEFCPEDHVIIDTVGEGGGFILSPRSSTDEVKPENLKVMIDFTQEYGVYR